MKLMTIHLQWNLYVHYRKLKKNIRQQIQQFFALLLYRFPYYCHSSERKVCTRWTIYSHQKHCDFGKGNTCSSVAEWNCSTGLIGESLCEVFLQLNFVEVPAIRVVSLEKCDIANLKVMNTKTLTSRSRPRCSLSVCLPKAGSCMCRTCPPPLGSSPADIILIITR